MVKVRLLQVLEYCVLIFALVMIFITTSGSTTLALCLCVLLVYVITAVNTIEWATIKANEIFEKMSEEYGLVRTK